MSYFSSILASVNGGLPLSPATPQPRPTANEPKPIAPGVPAANASGVAAAGSGTLKRKLDATSNSISTGQPDSRYAPQTTKGKEWTGTAHSGRQPVAASPTLPTPLAESVSTVPKKGSYKEILARAQAAKSTPAASVGKITHKSQQFVSKREREKQEAEARARAKLSTAARSNGAGKRIDRKGAIMKPEPPAKIKKERAPLAYQGTARPGMSRTPSHIKAKAKRVPAFHARRQSNRDRSDLEGEADDGNDHKRYRYAGSSEDEEDESMEDDPDDMGGGGFAELEEEEDRALRAARKEDAEALKEENAHKQAKLERKKKLAALAAKAGRR